MDIDAANRQVRSTLTVDAGDVKRAADRLDAVADALAPAGTEARDVGREVAHSTPPEDRRDGAKLERNGVRILSACHEARKAAHELREASGRLRFVIGADDTDEAEAHVAVE